MSIMGRPKAELVLSEAERAALAQMRRRGSIGAAMKLRATIVALCAEGRDSTDVAEDLVSTFPKCAAPLTCNRVEKPHGYPPTGLRKEGGW